MLRIKNMKNFFKLRKNTEVKIKKSGQATYIAPLQPSTLATFRSWGDSTGAGRIRLARGTKVTIS